MGQWLNLAVGMIALLVAGFPIVDHFVYDLTDVDLKSITESKNNQHIDKVVIFNDGILQAKNVDVFIKKNNMNLTSSDCLEGTINNNIDTDDYLKIHFPKLSVDFECSLMFVGKNNTNIGYALISEEDGIVDEWYLNKDKVELRNWMLDLLYYFFIGYGATILVLFWLWRITPKNRKKLKFDSKFRLCLPDKHNKSLTNHDEKLILAIYNGKNDYESLHEDLEFSMYFIKIRVYLLRRKKILRLKDPISLDPNIKNNINKYLNSQLVQK